MPLSIALPSTKPAAEVPIGDGTIQGLEYTWFDYDMTDFNEKASQTNRPSGNRQLKFGSGKLSFEETFMIPDANISGFKIPNPLHRPLKDGSTISFAATNLLMMIYNNNTDIAYDLPGAYNGKPLMSPDGYIQYYPADVEIHFIQGTNLYLSAGPLRVGSDDLSRWNQIYYPAYATLRACMTSDKDYIYISVYGYSGDTNFPNIEENFYKTKLFTEPSFINLIGSSTQVPHFKLSGKLLY